MPEDSVTGSPSLIVCPIGPSLEARVDGFGLERQHTEHALVHSVERLAADEALELAGGVVLRAVDGPQLLAPAALDPRLDEPFAAARGEGERLDDHAALRAADPLRVGGGEGVAGVEVPAMVAAR